MILSSSWQVTSILVQDLTCHELSLRGMLQRPKRYLDTMLRLKAIDNFGISHIILDPRRNKISLITYVN